MKAKIQPGRVRGKSGTVISRPQARLIWSLLRWKDWFSFYELRVLIVFFLRPVAHGLLAATFLLSGCALPRVLKQAETNRTVVARPTPLTASGEAVPFEVIARVPADHLHKGVAYELLLRYRYEHGLREDTLGRIAFITGNYVYDDEKKACW